jgi:hypothetical protein
MSDLQRALRRLDNHLSSSSRTSAGGVDRRGRLFHQEQHRWSYRRGLTLNDQVEVMRHSVWSWP